MCAAGALEIDGDAIQRGVLESRRFIQGISCLRSSCSRSALVKAHQRSYNNAEDSLHSNPGLLTRIVPVCTERTQTNPVCIGSQQPLLTPKQPRSHHPGRLRMRRPPAPKCPPSSVDTSAKSDVEESESTQAQEFLFRKVRAGVPWIPRHCAHQSSPLPTKSCFLPT